MRDRFIKNRGFILGVVLLLSLLMAAFIFSYNSIVRNRNLQAHHYMSSEVVSNLAVSGLKLLSSKIETSFDEAIKKDFPDIFIKPAREIKQPIALSSYSDFCKNAQADFQRFLDSITELKESGVLAGGTPVCEEMEVSIDEITSLTPGATKEQFQRGRDPIEKCGLIKMTCTVRHFGIARQASISQQFRIVSMVPGPFARFSLFIKRTPYPDSYNALGVNFDGEVDLTYKHSPAGNLQFTGPLVVLNGTDSETITSDIAFKDENTDNKNLRERGWIYIGPSGAEARAPVFIKIPGGFDAMTGGQFMFGWPSNSLPKLLAPAVIEEGTDFRKSEDIADHNFALASKFHGFYTCEEDNPQGVGAKNLWPGLTIGDLYKPTDRFLSASTWLYPFGTLEKSSRTLVIGPVLAGYLKYYFIKSTGISGKEYKGLFSSLTPSSFAAKQSSSMSLMDYCYFWSGLLIPPILGEDFFLNGYDSFKLLMPYNSLPSKSPTSVEKGVAFNMIFDFMKYNRERYPDTEIGPGICQATYSDKDFLVPLADAMRSSPVKGVHPSGNMGIFFNENGEYNPNVYPDNCYFFGDLSELTVTESSLVSNRITNIIDLSDCESVKEESETVEKLLFKETKSGAKIVNEPRKSGIFLIRRRAIVSSSFEDALTLSSKEIHLDKPIIILAACGSINLECDIVSDFQDGAPKNLCSIALCQGDIYLSGKGITRTIHAYLAMVGANSGRLLKPNTLASGPDRFEIFGGLAVSELGLYQDKSVDPRSDVGSTMLHFPMGGQITYNSRFNPGLSHYEDSRILSIESISGELEIHGALE